MQLQRKPAIDKLNPDSMSGLPKIWRKFVNCPTRSETLRLFLEKKLNFNESVDQNIIDFGAGFGCEAEYLANTKNQLTLNEINPYFARLLRKRFGEQDNVSIIQRDWLDDWSDKKKYYDAALLLGNSLCLLESKDEVILALKNFKAVLKSNSLFIIDMRNFAYIDQRWRDLQAGCDYIKSDVMYCGKEFSVIPYRRDEKYKYFKYYDINSNRLVANIKMLDLNKIKLRQLIENSGFVIVNECYDLGLNEKENCEFITFVCSISP